MDFDCISIKLLQFLFFLVNIKKLNIYFFNTHHPVYISLTNSKF